MWSSVGRLSGMQPDLEKDGGGALGWSFHQNIPDSLGIWMSVAGMKLPPEQTHHRVSVNVGSVQAYIYFCFLVRKKSKRC